MRIGVQRRFEDNAEQAKGPTDVSATERSAQASETERIPVQRGQRTQHSAPNKSRRRSTHARLAREPNSSNTNDLTTRTKSAARLAAEAAFAPPQVYPVPTSQAQVSVRRSRSTCLAAAPVPESQLESSTQQLTKSSRVFRVQAEPTPHSTAPSLAATTPTTEGPTHNDSLAAKGSGQTSSSRIGSDRRPGPGRQVFHAALESQPERQPEVQKPQPRPGVLIAALQGVAPDLEMIAQALEFSLVDERVARQWLRLSRQLDELHEKIRALVQ